MSNSAFPNSPPRQTQAYIIKSRQGRSVLIADQLVHILAGVNETAGGYGAVRLGRHL